MSRVSNKQVLDAIEAMPAAIAAALAGTPAQSAPIKAETTEQDAPTVDKAYLSHVSAKLQKRANGDGKDYVLYARKNVAGETKLAYCVADKFAGLTDRRIIGAVSTISPE